MKRTMGYCFRRSQLTALVSDIRQWFRNLDLECVFEPTHLVNPKLCNIPIVAVVSGVQCHVVSWAVAMNLSFGYVYRNDLLHYKRQGEEGIGFVIGFFKIDSGEQFAMIRECTKVSETEWVDRQALPPIALQVPMLMGALHHLREGDRICPNLPLR
jgi:hypothetical protein